jgi:NTE family protein
MKAFQPLRNAGWVFFFLLTIYFLGTQLLWAQEAGSLKNQRPKIGLVLGGGGARGAAHIGVLKVLEENKVPVDFVVGTSMGSIVGGLYASGMSPQDIEEQINRIDWVEMFKDRPAEEYLSFRNKKDQQRLFSIETGVKDGKIALPFGVMAGQKLGFELKKLTLPVGKITDFDKLSIPFRAVATNLHTGEMVVLKNGNLAEAMRASMSIPGVWPPVEREGLILVDGFLVCNVPVEVAKDLGADVIIAVSVDAPLSEKKEFESLIDVIGQMTAIFAQQNVDKSRSLLDDDDVFINPDLPGISTAGFTDMPAAIKKGEEAAGAVVAKLKRYAVSEAQYAAFLAQQRRKGSFPEVIHEIRIAGLVHVSEPQVRGRISTQTGKPLDVAQLRDDITRIYAMGDFESVDFKLLNENGRNILVIAPKEKPWGPNYLRFGLNFSGDTSGDNRFSALIDYRMTQMNSLGGEWKNVVEFGSNRGIFSEWYQPLDTRDYFFVAPFVKLRRDLADVYEDNQRIATYETKYMGAGLGLGVNFRSYAQARIDYLAGVINAKPETGGTTLPKFDNTKEGAMKFTLDFDQLNDHKFPKKGFKVLTEYFESSDSLGGDFSYQQQDFTLVKATTPKPRHTVISVMRIGTTYGNNAPYYDKFALGGFLNLSGYSERQLLGQHRGVGQLLYYYKFGKDLLGSGGNIYLGGGAEYGNVWERWHDTKLDDMLLSGLLFVGLDSPFGPLYLAFAQAEGDSEGRVYLYLGKTF